MVYVIYVLFALASFTLNVFLWLTCWFWAIIPAVFKLKNLPGSLWYFQTHDDWVYGFGWEKPNPPSRMFDRWKIAMWWIARNPGYAFDSHVLGFPAVSDGVNYRGMTDEDLRRGVFTRFRNGTRFSYRRNLYFSKNRYIKLWFGWKPYPLAGWHMLVVDAGLKTKD